MSSRSASIAIKTSINCAAASTTPITRHSRFASKKVPCSTRSPATCWSTARPPRKASRTGMKALAAKGKAGDFVVLFLSGHGDRPNKKWAFLARDFTADEYGPTTISDESILRLADALAGQGKKAIIMVDACFAGQL